MRLRDSANISSWTPGASMFGVPYYSDKLENIRQELGAGGMFQRDLIAIDVANKVATFRKLKAQQPVKQLFDILHVAPPCQLQTY
jgi:hypothetical protein